MLHPGKQLTLSFLPKLLVNFLSYDCRELCQNTRIFYTCSSPLAQRYERIYRGTQGFISVSSQCGIALEAENILFRGSCRIAANFLCRKLVGFIALIPLFAIIRHLTKRMNSYYTLIAALMLALEIAGNDFGGWVSELPDVRSTASDRLRRYISESQTRFLDFYMPNRAEVSGPELIEFAGAIKTDFDLGQAEHIRKVEAIFEKS